MSTIFTKIFKGEIPSYTIAQNDRYMAFLDISPKAKGHTLIIPKTEVDYLFDLEDSDLGGLMAFAKKIAHAIDQSLGTIRTAVLVEGLEVPHAHVHLYPLYEGNRNVSLHKPSLSFSDEEMKAIAATIKSAL